MAPVQPSHRTSRPAKSILKTNPSQSGTTSPNSTQSKSKPLFPTTKVDKRRIKHANLMSKVSKSTADIKKRRHRPNKKLVTTLDALADALPTTSTSDNTDTTTAGSDTRGPASQVNIIARKSMKSKPGALKRKQKLDNQEKERFAKNLAQLQGGHATDGAASASPAVATATQDRWAALRGFIGQTLERRPEVVAGDG